MIKRNARKGTLCNSLPREALLVSFIDIILKRRTSFPHQATKAAVNAQWMQLSEQLEQAWAPVPATTCETVRDRMARLLEWSYQLPRVCKRHKTE